MSRPDPFGGAAASEDDPPKGATSEGSRPGAGASLERPAALLVTGTVGVGKTSVADAAGSLLAAVGVPHAVIDLDELRRCWPRPAHDPFHSELTLRNLRTTAAHYRAAGATALLLAGVVESTAERDAHAVAVGVPLTLVRLRAELEVVDRRLADRHARDVDPSGLPWHRERARELIAIQEHAGAEDHTVDAERPLLETARAVLGAAGWPH